MQELKEDQRTEQKADEHYRQKLLSKGLSNIQVNKYKTQINNNNESIADIHHNVKQSAESKLFNQLRHQTKESKLNNMKVEYLRQKHDSNLKSDALRVLGNNILEARENNQKADIFRQIHDNQNNALLKSSTFQTLKENMSRGRENEAKADEFRKQKDTNKSRLIAPFESLEVNTIRERVKTNYNNMKAKEFYENNQNKNKKVLFQTLKNDLAEAKEKEAQAEERGQLITRGRTHQVFNYFKQRMNKKDLLDEIKSNTYRIEPDDVIGIDPSEAENRLDEGFYQEIKNPAITENPVFQSPILRSGTAEKLLTTPESRANYKKMVETEKRLSEQKQRLDLIEEKRKRDNLEVMKLQLANLKNVYSKNTNNLQILRQIQRIEADIETEKSKQVFGSSPYFRENAPSQIAKIRKFYNENPNAKISKETHPEQFKTFQGILKTAGIQTTGMNRGLKEKSATHRLGQAELYLQNTKNNPYYASSKQSNPLATKPKANEKQQTRQALNPGVPQIVTLSELASIQNNP